MIACCSCVYTYTCGCLPVFQSLIAFCLGCAVVLEHFDLLVFTGHFRSLLDRLLSKIHLQIMFQHTVRHCPLKIDDLLASISSPDDQQNRPCDVEMVSWLWLFMIAKGRLMLPEPNYTMRCIIHEKGSISSMSGPSPIHSAACRETRIEASPHLSAQGFLLHLVWQYRGNCTTAKEYEARQLPTIYCVQMWFNLVKSYLFSRVILKPAVMPSVMLR